MEYMCAITMDIDALYIVAMDIATRMVTAIYDEALLATLSCLMRKDAPEETSTDYEIIVHCDVYVLFFLCTAARIASLITVVRPSMTA